jgi:nickel/cobalt transporter (NiCoT) family protein
MILASVFTVFALGLRHGADPDHLAAIDNVTRNSYARMPFLSRFVGTLFALGHSVMVLVIAAIVGYLGARFAAHSQVVELIGTWISIAILVLLAGANIRQLTAASGQTIAGVRTRLLPKALREGTSALLAIPIGLLFGVGFETSSQIATYTIAFTVNAGVVGAVLVGAAFCVGMICTDTLDSLLVHRLVSYHAGDMPRVVRVWLWSVTIIAVFVAAYELAQVLGWQPPIESDHADLIVSIGIVALLIGVFVYVYTATRRETPGPSRGQAL